MKNILLLLGVQYWGADLRGEKIKDLLLLGEWHLGEDLRGGKKNTQHTHTHLHPVRSEKSFVAAWGRALGSRPKR